MNTIIRIALADDHKLVRSGITLILNDVPHYSVVQQAANGQELIDGLETSKPDLILLDLEMPVLSGQETLKQIRLKDATIPVLILTMHDNTSFILQMMELGANGYLLKDTNPAEVVNAIQKVMDSGYYFSEKVSMAMLHGIADPDLKKSSELAGHGLTGRELDVLRLISKEMTTTEIGEALFLSPKTIEGYRKVLMEKTEARNMAGLVLFAVRHGLVG